MSAIEWLHFIDPFIIAAMAIALLASLPVTAAWREQLSMASKPMALKKTLTITFIFIALGWLLARFATHISTPVIRVNILAASQLILIITLTATFLIILTRAFQKNNIFSLLIILTKRYFPLLIAAFGTLISSLLILFLNSSKENREKHDKENENSSKEHLLEWHMNYRGEYCDQDKLNWH